MGRNKAQEEIDIMNYEHFMNRAYKLNRRIKVPHKMELGNLINAEYGINLKLIGSHRKQLNQLKKRIRTGIQIMLPVVNNKELYNLYTQTTYAKNSNELILIINKGLILSEKLK
ncbi:hypothetical protein [Corallibacter sp.]|uniref:hypothetical protein n=1 Tax=Corallibacter sp. TaxID=2038084 RepID=UPI003AB4BFAF